LEPAKHGSLPSQWKKAVRGVRQRIGSVAFHKTIIVPTARLEPESGGNILNPIWRRLVGLYVGVVLLGALTASGRIGTVDGGAMLNVARSVVHRNSFEASPCRPTPRSNHCVPGVDGGLYAGFGLLPSIMAAPPLIVGETLARVAHKDPYLVSAFLVSLSTLLVGAFIPVVLVLWLTRMQFSPGPSVATALLLFFGSVLWHESVKGFYSEPYFALALLLSAYLLYVARGTRGLLLAGFVFGCSISCRVFGAIFAPVLAISCFCLPVLGTWKTRFRRTLLFGIGASPLIAWVGWTNFVRFGNVFKTGYHLAYPTLGFLLSNPPLLGLRELIFDGEVGLLWFTPWVILLPWAARRFFALRPKECALSLIILVEGIIFFALYASWHGGWAYGPRLLMPCLPFAALPIVTIFEKWKNSRVSSQIVVAALAIVSAFIQLSGMPYPMARYYHLVGYYKANHEPRPWHGSIIFAQLEEFTALFRDLRRLPQQPVTIVEQQFNDAEGPSEEARALSLGPAEFLASFPNSINLRAPDLWLLKATRTGIPALSTVVMSLSLLLGGLWAIGKAGLGSFSGKRPPNAVTQTRSLTSRNIYAEES